MRNTTIKVASVAFSKNAVLRDELLAIYPGAVFNEGGDLFTVDQLADFADGADGLIIDLNPVDGDFLDRSACLKIISKFGVGMDSVDLEACRQRDVAIGWTGGVNRRSVAEMTLGFMLALYRNLYGASLELKDGRWNPSGGAQLTGKTVGIIGLGNVGKEVVVVLQPFDVRVLANDIAPDKAFMARYGIVEATKDQIYAEADVVTIHTQLTSETRAMIDGPVLKRMRPSAFLINTARGPIVSQEALKKALIEGQIAGAALDVFEMEPPDDAEFLKLPNLFCTPHIAGNSEEGVLAMGRAAIDHLVRYFGE